MQNEFVGIGAVLTDENGFCTIKELLPGGPAEASRELEPEERDPESCSRRGRLC